MPNLLTELDLDEVSLVGKAANGKKRFLIYKSQEPVKKTTKRDKMIAPQALEAHINKTVATVVQKALAAERKETVAIRKQLNAEMDRRRTAELTEIAKNHMGGLAPVDKTVRVLKAIETSGMSPEDQKAIRTMMKKSAAAMKESALFKSIGTSRPEVMPNSPYAAFEAEVEKRLAVIQKSDTAPKSAKKARSLAVKWVVQNRPDLWAAVSRGGN